MEFLSFLNADVFGHAAWTWLAFLGLVLGLLALDLGVFHRKAHVIGARESLRMSAFYVGLGAAFGGWIWISLGEARAMEYWTAFVVEKSLAMDNVFVIALIFTYFAVPREHQHRVLFWGILGVIVLRGIMIGAGAALVSRFDWVLLLFAAFLIYTGVKLLRGGHAPESLDDNRLIRFLNRRFRITDGHRGGKFFAREPRADGGRAVLHVTPIFVALVAVEFADVIFAVDSVPAVFAVSRDPFVVYTSNVFAILGLRALFFTLAAGLERLRYLKPALAVLLVFIGGKVIAAELMGVEKVPAAISLGVTFAILTIGVVASLWRTREAEAAAGERSQA